ncbi:MAG: flavodoxin family protein [Planctomycetota bacterium]|nr:flavodoxin family protein [Planctomycetota bacterium]
MNIVAVNGSPHGAKGATAILLAELVRSARAAGADVTTLELSDGTVGPCRACDTCHRVGTCPIKDDLARFRDPILAADAVVLASPNYLFSVSAQMKCFMDRCCGPLHMVALRGKYAAAVVSSGGEESGEVERYLLRFLRAFGASTVGSVGASAMELLDPARRPAARRAAAQLGADLVAAVAAKKSYPDQAAEQTAFAERMKAIVRFQKDRWTYEYQQWESRRWV